jgi:WhiB family transcriptional regulator, redox-sensing transcriptional regulator
MWLTVVAMGSGCVMTATVTDHATHWRDAGACLKADPDLFFPISKAGLTMRQIRRAKSICGGCPVRLACLRFALETRELNGVWGGTTPEERRSELRRRARGSSRLRPPA